MNTSRQFIIFRPEISSYQDANFRKHEMSEIKKISLLEKSLYIDDYSKLLTEIKKNPKLEIIFISTSYTKLELYTEILRNIILWVHPNSGYDNLTKDFIEKSDFPIINGNSIRADAVFQYILACFLESNGPIPFSNTWDKNRCFPRKNFYDHKSLIIGHGHIGSKLSSFFDSTGISYSIYDPYLPITHIKQVRKLSLAGYDSVILCCGLNSTTEKIINELSLATAKNDLTIINAARGALIDESALINFLGAHPKAIAYLDVYENEPNDLSQFSKLKNIKLTSHIAGVYDGIDDQIISFECQVIEDMLTLKKEQFDLKYKRASLKNNIIEDKLI